jgi:MFS family permease
MNASPGAVRPRAAGRSNGLAAFAVLAAVQFFLIAAITVLSVALPAIQRDLGLTSGELAMASASYGLSFSGLLVLGGRLADTAGHRRVFVVGLVVFGAASGAVALSPWLWTLLAARFAQGAGAALAAPAAMALLGSVFPDAERRERMTAIWGTVAGIGATAGTLLSGVVAEFASWRWTFGLLVLVAAAALLGTAGLVPPGPPPRRTRLAVPDAVCATGGLSAVTFGLVGSADHGWSSPVVLLPLTAGAVLLVAFTVLAARSANPLVPLSFFASGARTTALITVLVVSGAMSAIFFFLALHLQQVRDYSPALTSAAFLPFSLALLVAGATSGRLVGRFGPARTSAAGLALAAGGLLLLSLVEADGSSDGFVLAGLLVFPAGAALAFSGATVSAVRDVPEHDAGLAAGVVNTALEVGPAVGLAALVAVAAARTSSLESAGSPGAATGGYAFAFGVAAAAATALLTTAVLRARRTPNTTNRRTAS